MTLLEAISARHSVRSYIDKPLPANVVAKLDAKIDELNKNGNLHIQLVTNEPRAFAGMHSYGSFKGVTNYLVMAGKKDIDLDQRIGYYGQQLVLYAQTLGLNTCWVALTYKRIKGTYKLNADEKIQVYIAIGYGVTQGVSHKTKTVEQLGDVTADSPDWYRRGVEAARLAPTAINQQKFNFHCLGTDAEGRGIVECSKGFSLAGNTGVDLGIAKCNFEIGTAPVKIIFKNKI